MSSWLGTRWRTWWGWTRRVTPVPQLATSWDVDDVANTITFHLREGVKFHDGTDFNADAVKWNLEMFKNGEKKDLEDIESIDVDAADPYTIVLHMTR